MHTLVEDVLPYLAVFTLVDALVLVRASEWVLLAPWGRFRLERSGLHLAGLSPFAETVGLFVPSLLATRSGVLRFDAPGPAKDADTTLLPAEAASADGRWVRIGSTRIATPGPRAAGPLAARLRALSGHPTPSPASPSTASLGTVAKDRSARVPAERNASPPKAPHVTFPKGPPAPDARPPLSLDLARARERRSTELRLGPVLRWFGLALLVVTFGVLPASLAEGSVVSPGTALLALLALHIVIVAVAWTTLRRCGLSSGDATSAVGSMLIFPPAAIHAGHHVARDLYLDLDPMAAAAAILPKDVLPVVARRLVHRLEWLGSLGGEAQPAAAAQLEAWRAVLQEAGTSLERVLEAPSSSDPSAAFYCPICAGEYRAGFTTCSDCGLPLRALAAPQASQPVLVEA